MGAKKEPAKRICIKPEDVHDISSGQLPFCRLLFTFLSSCGQRIHSLTPGLQHVSVPLTVIVQLLTNSRFPAPCSSVSSFHAGDLCTALFKKLQLFLRGRRPVQQRPQKISLYEIVVTAWHSIPRAFRSRNTGIHKFFSQNLFPMLAIYGQLKTTGYI